MFRWLLVSSLLLFCICKTQAQNPAAHVVAGPVLPLRCSGLSGDVWYLTGTGNFKLYTCNASNQWAITSGSQITTSTSDPTGACTDSTVFVFNPVSGNLLGCKNNTWTVLGGTGSGITGLTLNKIPKATSSTTIGDSSLSDNGTTISTAEALTALSIALGASPPLLSSGTGAGYAGKEGTAPSVGPASGVDVCYFDSTQHGPLCNYNNAGYFPSVQGPASAVSGHVAIFNGTNGGNLSDGGVLPTVNTGTVNQGAIYTGTSTLGGSNYPMPYEEPSFVPTATASGSVLYISLVGGSAFSGAAINGRYKIFDSACTVKRMAVYSDVGPGGAANATTMVLDLVKQSFTPGSAAAFTLGGFSTLDTGATTGTITGLTPFNTVLTAANFTANPLVIPANTLIAWRVTVGGGTASTAQVNFGLSLTCQ